MKNLFFLLSILGCIMGLSCGRTEPLSTYKPKSPQEAALKSMLLEFQDGVNAGDPDKVGSFIHEDASIMIGRERTILSKAEYRQVLPNRLADNPPITLGRPKIKISGDQAEVRIYMTRGNYEGLIVYDMRLDTGKWYIQSWKY